MKRFFGIIALVCVLAFVSALAACSPEEPGPSPSEAPEREPAETQIPPGYVDPFSAKDIAIVIGDRTFTTGIDVGAVLEVLGGDYVYRESISCIRQGMEKTYKFEGLEIKTIPFGERDVVCLYRITGGDYTTSRGIGVGAPENALYAYPPDWLFDGTYYVHSLSNDPDDIGSDRIQILIEDGFVTEINVYSPNAGL